MRAHECTALNLDSQASHDDIESRASKESVRKGIVLVYKCHRTVQGIKSLTQRHPITCTNKCGVDQCKYSESKQMTKSKTQLVETRSLLETAIQIEDGFPKKFTQNL